MAFKKGQSGNPAGRAVGTTPGAMIRKAIELKADDILQSVINAAIGGDMQACKMLLDRITPILKTQSLPVNLPIRETLSQQGGEVIEATMTGQIPPDVGSQLISALANQIKIVELDELTKRIEVLENGIKK